MKKKIVLPLIILLSLALNSCAAIGDIFKTGMGVGIAIVVVIIIIIIAIIRGGSKK